MYDFDNQIYFDPLPENPTPEELAEYASRARRAVWRSIIIFFAMLVVMFVVSLLTSCGSTKTVTSTESRRVADMVDRLDSLMRLKTVVQQDSAWRESVMRQFQSIREKSDTSRSVTLSAAGDTIRERIIINNIRETTSETDRLEREVLKRRIESMDSTISLIRLQLSHSDSLLQHRETVVEKEVPAQLNWFQQMQLWLGRLVLVALAILLAIWIVRKRTWWLTLLRKVI